LKAASKELAYDILDVVIEAVMDKPMEAHFPVEINNSPRPPGISLSSAGKGNRFLAHMERGSQQKDGEPRYKFTMDMGTIAHDYIRQTINAYEYASITDEEREVALAIDGDAVVKGHIDGFLNFKRNTSGVQNVRILLDIKCVPLFTFNELDPRNPEKNWWSRSRKWIAGNYVFNASEAFADDDFKKSYLEQIAGYEAALLEEGEVWDATAFLLYNRDSSHFAVGIYNSEETNRILGDAKERILQVMDNPTPADYEPCWPAAVGSEPHTVCRYCDYLYECFAIKTKVFRGKPRMNILEIR
jgi:hypothetical protein